MFDNTIDYNLRFIFIFMTVVDDFINVLVDFSNSTLLSRYLLLIFMFITMTVLDDNQMYLVINVKIYQSNS